MVCVFSQAICSYFGPVLPLGDQRRGAHVLSYPRVPGVAYKDYVIDGDCANCVVETPRSPAIYANHSTNPNPALQARTLSMYLYIELSNYL